MMKIKLLLLGDMPTNGYVVSNTGTGECFIVDPAFDAEKIIEYIDKEGLHPVAILLTHGHYDHITALGAVKEKYDIPVWCGRQEEALLKNPKINLSNGFGHRAVTVVPDRLLDAGHVNVAGFDVEVIETPGHTAGGVCYYIASEKVLFSGDTLFRGTIGRTDLPTGNYEELLDSLNHKLMVLEDETTVYPGHGFRSSIAMEKKQNPYVEG